VLLCVAALVYSQTKKGNRRGCFAKKNPQVQSLWLFSPTPFATHNNNNQSRAAAAARTYVCVCVECASDWEISKVSSGGVLCDFDENSKNQMHRYHRVHIGVFSVCRDRCLLRYSQRVLDILSLAFIFLPQRNILVGHTRTYVRTILTHACRPALRHRSLFTRDCHTTHVFLTALLNKPKHTSLRGWLFRHRNTSNPCYRCCC
jgi:hypothetical protein